jgi:hypothetical protein
MITIAIDEYGDFNFLKPNSKNTDNKKNVLYISGIVYNDLDDSQDANFERQRLDRFFRVIADKENVSYPEAFYSKQKGEVSESNSDDLPTETMYLNMLDSEEENSEENSYAAKKTVYISEKAKYKRAIAAALPEFFAHGTYNGEELVPVPRRGFYSIAVMLKSEKGKSMFNDEQTGVLSHDDTVSNLYWHMADATVSRLVFHNPYNLDVNRVQFDLPTRITEVAADNPIKIEEFKALGFKEYVFPRGTKPNPHKVYFQVANEFNYRAALELKSVDYNRLNMDIKTFKALSINYDAKGRLETEKYAFLYLANFLCGHFSFYGKLHTLVSDMSRFEAIRKLTDELNGSAPNLLFVYDDVDINYEQAMIEFCRQNYVAALSHLYDGAHGESNFAEFYRTEWFPHIEELIHGEMDVRGIERAIQDLAYYADDTNCNANKLVYMFKHLEQLVISLENQELLDGRIAYAFYDTGMTAFNHVGDNSLAEYCFLECRHWSRYVPIEDYLLTLKRHVVSFVDCYLYNDALQTSRDIVSMEEHIQTLRAKLYGSDIGASISLGQAYSQLGQVYAYLQDPDAEKFFKNALSIFDDTSADAYRTQSYLLHYYIEVGDKASYEQLAVDYFGGNHTLADQLSYIQSLPEQEVHVQSMAFALYVYVKALYVLYRDDIGAFITNQLHRIEQDIRKAVLINSHPWELIYTYLSLIALQVGNNPLAIVWRDKIKNSVYNPGKPITHRMIYGLMRFYEQINDTKTAQNYREKLIKDNVDIEQYMTYMNR